MINSMTRSAAWNALLVVLLLITLLPVSSVFADQTVQGPSGFIMVPSGTTITAKGIEWAAHTRLFRVPGTTQEKFLTSLALGFSPLRDFEIGIEKDIDQRRGEGDFDPNPTVNFKVRLPPMGTDFSNVALGMLLDTNPNNYHTLYATVGGCGVGWNFGGNPGSGIAHYGQYDRSRQAPKSVCLLIGGEIDPRKPGERGYRGSTMVDYNGDIISIAWRYKSHRGFWADIAASSKGSYTDFYDFQPITVGVGANF